MTRPKTLLVVDDSAVMRQMIAAVFDLTEYRVLLADGGPAALAQAASHPLDLVITDWTMMPMDGGELIRQLRRLRPCAQVPVLVLSTLSSDASKAEARAAGANGWLCKPLEPNTLLDVVACLTEKIESADSASA